MELHAGTSDACFTGVHVFCTDADRRLLQMQVMPGKKASHGFKLKYSENFGGFDGSEQPPEEVQVEGRANWPVRTRFHVHSVAPIEASRMQCNHTCLREPCR